MRAFLLWVSLLLSGLIFAQSTAAEFSPRRLVHSFSVNVGVLPSTFLRAREEYTVDGQQGNFWQERYKVGSIAYEIGSAAATNILHYRLEVGFYDFKLDDYRGGVFSPLISFSEWEGRLLTVAPSVLAIPAGDTFVKPVLGVGVMFTFPLEDELIFTYSEVEQSNAGSPLITVQKNAILNGAGVFFIGGSRFRIMQHLHLGANVKAIWLQQQANYIERRGAYNPASLADSRSLFSRKVQFWGNLALTFTI